MQKLSEIFEQLTHGELSQVFLGGADAGEILEDNYRHIGNHVKLGLTSLYKRFNLKQGRVTLQLFPTIDTYSLQSKYAVNGGGTEPVRWILDTPGLPFGEDILKILSVTGDSGFPFELNNYADDFSIITPTLDSVRVPALVLNPTTDMDQRYLTSTLTLEYQANHPKFMTANGFLEPERTNIELPDSHTQALLYFVASRVHNPIGMGQEFNAGNNWAQRYEAECRRLEEDGHEIDDACSADRIQRGGWV